MNETPNVKPPRAYEDFVSRFPELGRAWDLIHEGGARAGPLDERTCRLVRLGIAIAAKQEGAVHASVRKGLALGITREELEQVCALAAGTIGLPAAVAAFCQVREVKAPRGAGGDQA
jgi:alkylhydroperoxidase/carboxymuconolactone decarboxylase family protein YurZ